MNITAPCRIGEKFTSQRVYSSGRYILTGLSFFYWETRKDSGVTLCGKRDPWNSQENTSFYDPKEPTEGVRIEFEVPDAIFIPGYPLRELGLNTDAVGHIGGLTLTEDAWAYYIYYGKSYGGPMKPMRTPELDKLFAPVLPLRAVRVELKDYLL